MRKFVFLLCTALVAAHQRAEVVQLTQDNFDELTEEGFWLLEFYAPWCGHCKQLAPVLDATANVVAGKMRIGKIDATQETSLAERFSVKGYPTLRYRRDGGELQTYPGPRNLETFEVFANRMTSPAVSPVETIAALERLTGPGAVSFVYGQGEKEDPELYEQFNDVAHHYQATLDFGLVTGDKPLKRFREERPFVARIEKNEETVYWDPNGTLDLKTWVEEQRHQVLSELGTHNFRDLGQSGRILVVGVTNPKDARTQRFVKFLRGLARVESTTLPMDVFEQLRFGWLDGVTWDKFVEQYNFDGPAMMPGIFLLDMPNGQFWQDPDVRTHEEMEAFIVAAVRGEVPVQYEGWWGMPDRLRRLFVKWWPWSILFVVPPILLVLTCSTLFSDPPTEEEKDPNSLLDEDEDEHDLPGTKKRRKRRAKQE